MTNAMLSLLASHQGLVRYTISPCSLGQAAIAVTGRGVALLMLDDSVERLRTALAGRASRLLPATQLVEDDDVPWQEDILTLLELPATAQQVPLDLIGTDFQQRVWQALRTIAPGERRSYAALATQLGCPAAVRAVANACASNPVAVLVPCHRVVRSDGSLGGYRWGLARKQALLERERRGLARVRSLALNACSTLPTPPQVAPGRTSGRSTPGA